MILTHKTLNLKNHSFNQDSTALIDWRVSQHRGIVYIRKGDIEQARRELVLCLTGGPAAKSIRCSRSSSFSMVFGLGAFCTTNRLVRLALFPV